MRLHPCNRFAVLAFVLALMGPFNMVTAMEQTDSTETLPEDRRQALVQIARAEMLKTNLSPDGYRVFLEVEGSAVHVSFQWPQPEGKITRGGDAAHPGFEVTMDAQSGAVLNRHFSR